MFVAGYNADMAREPRKPSGRPRHTDEERLFKRQVGNNLKVVREGMQADTKIFAAYLGVPKGTYEKYELGIAFPKPQVWKRLTELNVSTEFIFTGIGKPFLRPIDMTLLTGSARQRASN